MRRLRFVGFAVFALAVLDLACSSWPGRTDGAGLDGNRRLGREVVPERYALDLWIDPQSDRFSGVARASSRGSGSRITTRHWSPDSGRWPGLRRRLARAS